MCEPKSLVSLSYSENDELLILPISYYYVILDELCDVLGPRMVPLSWQGQIHSTILLIFPSQVITCDGVVVSWRFYAIGASGVIMAGIWQQASIDTFTLIGKTRLNVSTIGAQVCLVHMSQHAQLLSSE